ncbi:hypothetical protein BDV93DRAFT_516317 [Ceratobasidium sp. AG-I]|nr:hypothetical protein BDV93DRAFT_516317 [Ceratobasidium sp. AG-I]
MLSLQRASRLIGSVEVLARSIQGPSQYVRVADVIVGTANSTAAYRTSLSITPIVLRKPFVTTVNVTSASILPCWSDVEGTNDVTRRWKNTGKNDRRPRGKRESGGEVLDSLGAGGLDDGAGAPRRARATREVVAKEKRKWRRIKLLSSRSEATPMYASLIHSLAVIALVNTIMLPDTTSN